MNGAWMAVGIAFGVAIASAPAAAPSPAPVFPLASAEFRAKIENYCSRYKQRKYFDECVADRLASNHVR